MVLPVWLSHQDAGLALSGSALKSKGGNSPHELSFKILEELGIKIEPCFLLDLGSIILVEVGVCFGSKIIKLQRCGQTICHFVCEQN